MLIGLVGKIESGKTTVANFIKEQWGDTILIAFADPLKEMILKAGLCTKEELWGKKTKFSRLMMQKIGTEIFRNQIDKNYWIKKTDEKIKNSKSKNIVVHDVRFIDEAICIKKNHGLLVKIIRPEKKLGFFSELFKDSLEKNHISEVEQDLIKPDIIIDNDSSIEDLKKKIKSMIKIQE